MTTRLKLSTQRGTDGTPVVTAVGEIDMSNAASFREALSARLPLTAAASSSTSPRCNTWTVPA